MQYALISSKVRTALPRWDRGTCRHQPCRLSLLSIVQLRRVEIDWAGACSLANSKDIIHPWSLTSLTVATLTLRSQQFPYGSTMQMQMQLYVLCCSAHTWHSDAVIFFDRSSVVDITFDWK